MKKIWSVRLILGLACLSFIAGCAQPDEDTAALQQKVKTEKKKLNLVYVEWSSEVASTHVVKAVLQEKLGYEVETIPVSAAAMWQALASGAADAMVAAWLPTMHKEYMEKVKDKIDDLGPNLEGTRVGLVVPSYVEINSIEELKENADLFENRIIGIDPGAGLMIATEKVIAEYGLTGFELMEGSGATMTAALDAAIKEQRPVIVTGWTPHWKFFKWDLKYLDDPKKIYGEAEFINTIARKGLKADSPEAYAFLDKFEWTPADMQKVMFMNQKDGADPYETAKQWISQNEEKVDSWLH